VRHHSVFNLQTSLIHQLWAFYKLIVLSCGMEESHCKLFGLKMASI